MESPHRLITVHECLLRQCQRGFRLIESSDSEIARSGSCCRRSARQARSARCGDPPRASRARSLQGTTDGGVDWKRRRPRALADATAGLRAAPSPPPPGLAAARPALWRGAPRTRDPVRVCFARLARGLHVGHLSHPCPLDTLRGSRYTKHLPPLPSASWGSCSAWPQPSQCRNGVARRRSDRRALSRRQLAACPLAPGPCRASTASVPPWESLP
jgi:hypothetical protein